MTSGGVGEWGAGNSRVLDEKGLLRKTDDAKSELAQRVACRATSISMS